MTEATEQLLQSALALPDEERLSLIEALMAECGGGTLPETPRLLVEPALIRPLIT